MDLDCLACYAVCHLRCVIFSHGAHNGSILVACILCHSGVVDQAARCFDLSSHIGQHKADSLIVGDWPAKLFSLLCVVGCFLETALGNTKRLCGNAKTSAVQGGHCDCITFI